MLINTKKLLAMSVAVLASLLAAGYNAQASEEADFEVIMLGVGSPPPFMNRFGA